MKIKFSKIVSSISPGTIESIAAALFLIIVGVGIWVFFDIPKPEFTRPEILKVIEAIVGSLGVVSLLFLWAQLRHTAILAKLLCYHQYFHDLPNIGKVNALYRALGRCKVETPNWHKPLTETHCSTLLSDTEPAPENAESAIREYLNDFEEFAAAVNSGLVDEDYVYKIEGTRALNAFFGFERMINHWHAEDKKMSDNSGGRIPVTTNYYGELWSVVNRWKKRKAIEMDAALTEKEKRRIIEQL